MKRFIAVAISLGILAAGSVWLHAQRNDARRVDSLLPSGALLYLEAKDFHQVLTQWNASEERRRWLKSDNASVLSQSRLLQRLMEARTQFATVAGVPVAMNLVNELAGGESAFAFYEFSTVHFVYLTRLAGGQLDRSSLWNRRSAYQTREAEGIPFYSKTQSDGHETYTVAFASHDGWLVLATDPALMARTLVLLSGQPAGSIAGESWYADTVKQSSQQGDLRLVYNLAALRKSPQFRTYWLQRNNTELAGFTSGSADLFEQPSGFEERRALLRAAGGDVRVENAGLTQVLSHIPQNASLYRAWAAPSQAIVKVALEQVALGESAGGAADGQRAPQVASEAPTVGSESDLETRIDEPVFQRSAANHLEALTDVVLAMQPRALLHSQVTEVTGDRVFVLPQSEVAIACTKPDRAALDKALAGSVNLVKTGSLDPLRTSDEGGGVLVLSRLGAHAALAAPAVSSSEVYTADYEHAGEWPRYKRLFGLIDRKTGPAPAFFSNNLQSLGDSLYRLRRVSMITEEEGSVTRDTLRYEFAPK